MAQTNQSAVVSETKQMGRFGLIGIINTTIDFGLFNIFISIVGLPIIAANVGSTSVAMTFSFLANRSFVFRSRTRSSFKQALVFISVTAFSVYVLQNTVLYFFSQIYPDPLQALHQLFKPLIGSFISLDFAVNNGAKALAVGFGMVWNYLWYKKVVFK